MRNAAALMMTVVLVSSVNTQSQGVQLERPSLVVQVVGSAWLPLPGLTVFVMSTPSCSSRNAAGRASAMTDTTGSARFNVSDQSVYMISIKKENGFGAEPICVQLIKRSEDRPTAYVQLRANVTNRVTVR
jgi:hypothetical protein